MRRLLPLVNVGRVIVCGAMFCGLASPVRAEDPPKGTPPKATKPAKLDQAALEKAFSDKLSGSALVGSFTTDGNQGAKPDRYKIVSAKKVKDNDWIFTATMKIGQNELDIPIPIKVYWADDTPVMSLTDLTIPGVGTFTSRVMFFGDRYAGTWQHGDHGGTFFGVIEKAAKPDAPKPDAAKPDAEKK